jgi:hypothetical protein
MKNTWQIGTSRLWPETETTFFQQSDLSVSHINIGEDNLAAALDSS